MNKSVVLLLVVLVSGCAAIPYEPYAREVKKKPREGGVIALRAEHRPEDRARADFLMNANCGTEAVVAVAEEGEVVVGEKTNTSGNKYQETQESGFRLGGVTFGSGVRPGEQTNVESQTSQIREWQIAYQCTAVNSAPLKGKKANARN